MNQRDRSNPNHKKGNFFVYFVSPWRHGRVVRRGTANPFSPVQIRVSPDQQKRRNTLFHFPNITCLIFPQQRDSEQGIDELVVGERTEDSLYTTHENSPVGGIQSI